ncbi:hypothetical protein [Halococcoides cellulosivorans]|uniref:hypothetical protein n=1 Tax=Halococcoides cellulosivorans TaxID=1679096 RepID=UPI00131F1BF6|nr:hypothetical protein [Halococcoides cellulosivorans]
MGTVEFCPQLVPQCIPNELHLGVVEQTREVNGSPMYQISQDSTVAQDLAQFEWDLLDVVAEDA